MTFKNKTIIAVAIACLSASTALAKEEQLVKVENYSGIYVGTGMEAKVACGNENSVTLKGEKEVLDNITVNIKNDTLRIQRSNVAGGFLSNLMSGGNSNNNGHVEVTITTTSDLSGIDASTGATLVVPECAVNLSSLDVDASTGAVVNVSGMTSQLRLDLSTGSTFNGKASQLTVDNAFVDLSTGATANLCGATTVTGDASVGAVVYVGSTADVNVDLSVGAETSSRRCQ